MAIKIGYGKLSGELGTFIIQRYGKGKLPLYLKNGINL